MADGMQILGYDVRFFPDGWREARWDDLEQARAFFGVGRQMPRSVDPDCWPSRFALEAFGDDATLCPGSVAVAENEDVVLDVYGVWPNLARMLARRGPLLPEDAVVCVGLAPRTAYGNNFPHAFIFDDVWWEETQNGTFPVPPTEDALREEGNWDILGYDVADAAFASAIWSLDRRDPDLAGMADKTAPFARKLNGLGLFLRLDDAKDYCALVNGFLGKQAPFYIFCLFQRRTETTAG